MLTSSLAPGAAAAKYWKVLLEASTRPEHAPAERLQPLEQRPVGVDRDARTGRSCSSISAPGPAWRDAEQLGQPALVADLHDDRARSPSGGEQAERAAIVVLPTPPLPVTTSSLRSSTDVIAALESV